MEVQTNTKITKSTPRKKRRDNSLYTQMIINKKVLVSMKNNRE